ncbi:MAG: EAL domain-containing protein [Myxococcales bacterium]|nr:EAL domain-containing protein [Myxococcales bacterium]
MIQEPSGRVLVVDDDEVMLKVCSAVLSSVGLTADLVSNPLDALARIRSYRYDAIVSDIRMPGGDGISLLRAARAQDATVPFVLMTGAPSVETAVSALEYGALKYLQKPFSVDELAHAVSSAVHRRVQSEDLPALRARLDHALSHLWMAYQPIVSWGARAVFSYEALFRTTAKDVNGPLEMLDLAERTQRLFDVGRAIRARVAHDAAALTPGRLLFVNLHPADLDDPELYRSDAPLTAQASRVVLEITERASIADLRDVLSRVSALRALGYRVAIDDLGAGYAGLTTFAQVQPEFVKLDGSLVRGIEKDRARQVVVSSMINAARALGSQVIAEALETRAERQQLEALGVDLLQGFYFCRPERPFASPRAEAMSDG